MIATVACEKDGESEKNANKKERKRDKDRRYGDVELGTRLWMWRGAG